MPNIENMPHLENTPPGVAEPAPAGRFDQILPFAAIAGLAALALAFWVVNGPSVFAEMITAAWALCF